MRRQIKLFFVFSMILMMSSCFNQDSEKRKLEIERNKEKELVAEKNIEIINIFLNKYKATQINLLEDDFDKYTFEIQEKIKEGEIIGFEFNYDFPINRDIFKSNNTYILEIEIGFKGKLAFSISINPTIFEKIKKSKYGYIIVKINNIEISKSIKAFHSGEETDIYPSNHIYFNGDCLDYLSLKSP